MDEERVERRLSAILAADIAGYSALMGADEARTVRHLKCCRWLASSAGAQCSQSHLMLSVLQKTAIEQEIFLCSILGNKAS